MARFSTNAQRDAYWAKYCRHCIHGGTDDGGEPVACPVFGLHLFGESEGTNEARDVLIPRDDKTNFKCTMFSPTTKDQIEAQRATIERQVKTIFSLEDKLREAQHRPTDKDLVT